MESLPETRLEEGAPLRRSRLYATTNDAPCRRRHPVYIVNLPRLRAIVVSRRQVHRAPSRLPVYIETSHWSSPTIIIQGDTPWGETESEKERGRDQTSRKCISCLRAVNLNARLCLEGK